MSTTDLTSKWASHASYSYIFRPYDRQNVMMQC